MPDANCPLSLLVALRWQMLPACTSVNPLHPAVCKHCQQHSTGSLMLLVGMKLSADRELIDRSVLVVVL